MAQVILVPVQQWAWVIRTPQWVWTYPEITTDEVLRIERTIERGFTHLSNLISLHYYSSMTNYDFTQIIKPNQYTCFFNVHIEQTRIIVWK
ncbi:unnamed protein product [Rotaria sordida]|uniref:Uncharacterized protein n=1 Tax=Rotaria sordida TaxID=392033 RepID=A0A819KZH3_9BILA|nr:unnamed protein product [Rotaria sordida]